MSACQQLHDRPVTERRRVDPQLIGLAHVLGYGLKSNSIDRIVKSVSRERRAAVLTLLAGGAIS